MLISYAHKFLFVHVYKVAGTSIRDALAPFAHNPDKTLLNRGLHLLRLPGSAPFLKSRRFPSHITALELREVLPPKIFANTFKFSFVRNPWDWQVSLYHYARQDREHPQHSLVNSLRDFTEYLQWRVQCDKHLQQEMLVDESGRLLVDFVGRYERLNSDFAHICDRIGIQATLPLLNASRRDDYRAYYSQRTMRLVADHFRADIERFEYTFDSSEQTPAVYHAKAA